MSFEWQTEEENWDETATPAPVARSRWSRWWFVPAFILPALLLTTLLVRRQINQRVDNVSAAITNDVSTSVAVLRRAVAQNDVELFVNLLSGHDLDWANQQQTWFRGGAYRERAGLGLTWLPKHGRIITTTLSPDLLQATVLLEESYAIDIGRQQTETVRLRHVETYRQGATHWLLSAPEPPPATDPATYEGQHLTLRYTTADAPTTERLGPDLDRKLIAVCALDAHLDCPLNVRVTFVADAQLLANLTQPEWVSRQGLDMTLPAPSLVGEPVDEAAYQALLRGYANAIITAAFSRATGYTCCAHAAYYFAIRDHLLHRLGLKPWRLTERDYAGILDHSSTPLNGGDLWSNNTPDADQIPNIERAYALIAFILDARPDVSEAHLLREMTVIDNPFSFWLFTLLPNNRAITQDWFRFLQRQTRTPDTPPIPWPDEAVYRLCTASIDNFRQDLYAFDPATRAVTTAQTLGAPRLIAAPTTDDDNLLLLQTGSSNLLSLWQAGQPLRPIALPQLPPSPMLFFAGNAGNDLLLSIFDNELRFLDTGRVAPAACAADTCSLTLFNNNRFALWSPDGAHALWSNQPWNRRQSSTEHALTLTDGDLHPLADAGTGLLPFWLDAQTFGYIRLEMGRDTPQPRIYLGTVDTPQPQPWLEPETWLSLLPGDAATAAWEPAGLWVDNANGAYLLLDLRQAADESRHILLLVERRSKAVSLLPGAYAQVTDAKFSPAGNWLALAQQDDTTHLVIYDLPQGRPLRHFTPSDASVADSFDWSADGYWLARGETHYLALYAPAFDYQQVLVPDLDFCNTAVWVR
ncbi:MAG: hypothetical protein KC418_17910 [Anaerolineales bacterium]|nr:hypothetical protein [Anaerolineales bacterium]